MSLPLPCSRKSPVAQSNRGLLGCRLRRLQEALSVVKNSTDFFRAIAVTALACQSGLQDACRKRRVRYHCDRRRPQPVSVERLRSWKTFEFEPGEPSAADLTFRSQEIKCFAVGHSLMSVPSQVAAPGKRQCRDLREVYACELIERCTGVEL